MKVQVKYKSYDSNNRGGIKHQQVIPTGANSNQKRINMIETMQEFYQLFDKESKWHHKRKLTKQKYDPAWTQHKNLEEAKKNNDKRSFSVASHHVWEADILRHNAVVDDVVYSYLAKCSANSYKDKDERDLYVEIYDLYYIELLDIHGAKTIYTSLFK